MLDVKMEHFRNLVSLAGVDGKIEEAELQILKKIATEQGIADDRLAFMLKKSSEYAFIIPQNQIERHRQMKDMIELAIIDDEFHKSEYELIQKVGKRLNFSESEIKDLIDEVIANTR